MCKYCENLNANENVLPNHNNCSDIVIEKDSEGVYIDIDYSEYFGFDSMYYRDYIYINYCPMCGRKLVS